MTHKYVANKVGVLVIKPFKMGPMKKTLLICLLSFSAHATTLTSVEAPYAFQDAPEYQAILAVLKSKGEFTAKTVQKVTPPAPKELSRGERMVEEAKARNRAQLAAMKKEETSAPKEEGLAAWKKEVKATQDGWKKEILETRRQWQREQDIFLGKIKIYKEATFDIPVKKEVIVEKKIEVSSLPDVQIVNGAFSIPVRDQLGRATCSSFSGIRAIEILLAQNKLEKDLSEQYFYWASKPKCHRSPCQEKGSWVTPGFKYSQNYQGQDIPTESACEYKTEIQEANETQVPLKVSCTPGEVKVVSYEEVRTIADAVGMLRRNVPVIMAAKLSENFYKNQGLITLSDSQSTGATLDGHAMGHAFLAVGLMELPTKIHESEGSFCIVIANSWGKGWGAGGYSCLTQKWLEKFRQRGAFAAVTKVSVK